MATPTLRAIRTRYADASITFLAVPNLVELIESGDWMDQVVTWPVSPRRNHLPSLLALVRRLRRERFDWAVLLPNSFRSALIARLAGPKRCIGYDRDARGWLLTDRLPVHRMNGKITPHPICDDYGRLAWAIGCDMPPDRLELFTDPVCEAAVENRIWSLGIAGRGPLVVITPGASFGSSKLWLPDRFAAMADRLIDSMGAAVVITCGPGEELIARNVAGKMRREGHVLADPVATLGELKALIKRSDLLVVNDTGPRHIAKAFNVPVVTIFGPTFPEWTDTDYPDERKVSVPVDCGPCQLKVCPLDHRCMTGVTVDMVYDRCVELLERRLAQASS